MLVLMRKTSQSIIIGKNLINIKVLSIKGGHVKIGIEAPKELSVYRAEIFDSILANDANSIRCLYESQDNVKRLSR